MTPPPAEEVGSPPAVRISKARAQAEDVATGISSLGDYVRVLRKVEVLKALSKADLRMLSSSLQRCTIPAGEVVMWQGELSSTFWISTISSTCAKTGSS